jgi:hypothetical protein
MAFDAARNRVFLYGGYYGDTWEYGTRATAAYSPFGQGCLGTAGIPWLGAVPPELPWIGSTLRVLVANVPHGKTTVMLSGFSRSRWGSVLLPFDLTPFGAPCLLHTSIDLTAVLPEIGGVATWTAAIANDPSLLGVSFYNQAFVIDPGANMLGLTASNAAAATLGAR